LYSYNRWNRSDYLGWNWLYI